VKLQIIRHGQRDGGSMNVEGEARLRECREGEERGENDASLHASTTRATAVAFATKRAPFYGRPSGVG